MNHMYMYNLLSWWKKSKNYKSKYHKIVQNSCKSHPEGFLQPLSLPLKCCLLGECTWPPQKAQSVAGTFLVTLQLELVESSTKARLWVQMLQIKKMLHFNTLFCDLNEKKEYNTPVCHYMTIGGLQWNYVQYSTSECWVCVEWILIICSNFVSSAGN